MSKHLQHDLAYRGLESGTIEEMDLYATDAEIQYYGLRSLQESDSVRFPAPTPADRARSAACV